MGRLNLYSMVRSSPQKTIYWNLYYNGSSQISSIREQIVNAVAQYTYAYDKVGRLMSATHAVKDANNNYVTDQVNSFSYDQFGNMLTNQLQYPGNPGQDSQITYDVNASNNRLSGYTDGQDAVTTAYDATGNLLAEGARSYAWDGAGRMTSVTGTDWGVYRYDALGRRVKKTYTYQVPSGTVSGNIISIYGAGNELMADYRTETTPSGSNNARTDYILNGSQAVARRTVTGGGATTTEYLRRGHLNQVIDMASYTISSGLTSMYGQPFSPGGNDQFAGHKDDPESGLHYNLARSYSSIMSRWPSPDSVTSNVHDPQMLNKYIYVRNDPIKLVDPDGRDPVYPLDFVGPMQTTTITVNATATPFLMDILPNITFPDQHSGAYVISDSGFEAFRIDPGLDYIRGALSSLGYNQQPLGSPGFVGPVRAEDLAAQVPPPVKTAISSSVNASNRPSTMAGDFRGGFHEEGGSWYTTTSNTVVVVPFLPGLANPGVCTGGATIDRTLPVDPGLINLGMTLAGDWHVHPSGTNGTCSFIQAPSGQDLRNATAPINIVVGAGSQTVYFYNTDRDLGSMRLRDFLRGAP